MKHYLLFFISVLVASTFILTVTSHDFNIHTAPYTTIPSTIPSTIPLTTQSTSITSNHDHLNPNTLLSNDLNYNPTTTPPSSPSPQSHNSDLKWQEPKIFVYVHPWGQGDTFLSIDCMIRSTQFLPTDSYSITISSLSDQTTLQANSISTPLNPTTTLSSSELLDYHDVDESHHNTNYHNNNNNNNNQIKQDQQQTPFTKVFATPFTSGEQCASVIPFTVTPIDTSIKQQIIPFPKNIILKNTENWINFRWESTNTEIHDELMKFFVKFTFTTTNPNTGHPFTSDKYNTVIQKLALAKKVQIKNSRVENRKNEDETIKNQFAITFTNVDYKLRSVMLALHGNHYFDGSFTTCRINDVIINSAFQLDVGVNLTVSDTPMGTQPEGTYILTCSDAYLASNNATSFGFDTILSVSGQPDSFWDDAMVYPAVGMVISGLKYQLYPNYTIYWVVILTLFIASTLASVIIVRCWSSDGKQVMVM